MLVLNVPVGDEYYDEERDRFTQRTETVQLEHSLLAVSKWEAKYEKPFLNDTEHSDSETVDYIKMMGVPSEIPDELFRCITKEQMSEINNYISKKHTATWFREGNKAPSRQVITSELIYYWMFSNQIHKDCELWNINRLLTLIRIFSEKNQPEKKMSREEVTRRNRELNAKRRAAMKTKG